MNTFSKIILNIFFILCITIILLNAQSKNSNFATDGIVEFFKIVDVLKEDKTPTEDDWKNFYASSGYRQLSEIEFGESYFKEILIVCFKPSEKKNEAALIERYQKEGGFFAWYTPNVISGFKEAEMNRSEMMNFVDYISSPEVITEVEKQIVKYLPETKIDTSFKINFVIFSDSRGYDPIIIGITNPGKYTKDELECLNGKGYDSRLPSTLLIAHEAFHNIRNKMLSFNRPKTGSADASLINALNKIEDEGIADQLQNHLLYSSDGCFPTSANAKRIDREQKSQFVIINAMNYFFSEIVKNPDLTLDLGNAMLGMIPRSGHPTGYYMANTIFSQFGIDELKKISTNPFQFFISYNNAAIKISGAPTFSEESINLIKKLEREYLKNNYDK